jgi:hypothetical protein
MAMRAIDIVRRLLPAPRPRTDPLAQARAWRERRDAIDAAGPCGMCRHHAAYPNTMPLLPHLFHGEMHG